MPGPVDLASLATCSGCGQGLRPAAAASAATNTVRRCYACSCPAVTFDADDLDEAIATAVLDLLAPRMRDLFTAESLAVGWRQATPVAQAALARIELAAVTVTATGDGFRLSVVGSPDLSDFEPLCGDPASVERQRRWTQERSYERRPEQRREVAP